MASAFTYIDVHNYTLQRHDDILRAAQAQGHSLDRGSYIEDMTIGQLDRLTRGEYDA